MKLGTILLKGLCPWSVRKLWEQGNLFEQNIKTIWSMQSFMRRPSSVGVLILGWSMRVEKRVSRNQPAQSVGAISRVARIGARNGLRGLRCSSV
ncbi:hypothetical protein HMPREF0291_11956 [Corynebacterium genitalium ATCC 33030]|uniref:Uncharacterized protein n=1 Tax=Corynebacterium genitalium ATCC 33030 TaxID=585529 RepID=D7WDR8_9CORY|nr:hypothetical protein HMPREF0291_11956 [Corynebacterium genitalium ATCC 33030]